MALNSGSIQQLTLQYEVADALCTNVFYYGGSSASLPCSAAALSNKFIATVLPALQAVLTNECRLRGIDVRPLVPTAGPPARDMLGNAVGSLAFQSMPSNVCAHYVGLQSEVNQRVRRRWYFSGWPESWFEDGLWDTSAHATPIAALGQALKEPLAAGAGETDAIPCIRHNTAASGAPPVYSYLALTGWGFSPRAATQRRRTVYQTRSHGNAAEDTVGDYDDSEVWLPITTLGETE